jgi:hypothetical protein
MFAGQSAGLLVCTDVAARGLDIPGVDWIIQVSGILLLYLILHCKAILCMESEGRIVCLLWVP